ncbi:MAG: class I SAM-dependent methyltransferase [Eubacteriales bacterium]
MTEYKIADCRLAAAASYARRGKRVADIGTDHASLPIYLVGNGIAPSALACDINKGPLKVARANISEAGLFGKIETLLADGLKGTEAYAPEDIYILGMGGELIWRIIEDAPQTRNSGVRMILQPMTHAHDLRKGLYDGGYNIVAETLVRDRERIYHIIVAEYDAVVREYSGAELWLGKHNIARGGDEIREIASLYASAMEKKIKGFATAGKSDKKAEALFEEFKRIARGEE